MDNVSANKVVYVADAMMGQGKTSAAITYMNRSKPDDKFFFLSPYVKEGDRIHDACPDKHFAVLEEKRGSKLNDLRIQLKKGNNVASTHALLERYTEDILSDIKTGKYTLILDEAYSVTRTVSREQKNAFLGLLGTGVVTVDKDTHRVSLTDGTGRGFENTELKGIIGYIATGSVYYYQEKLLVWVFPIEILEAFSKIIVLTYMFPAQILSHYLAIHGYEFEYLGTRQIGAGQYEFCPYDQRDRVRPDIKDLIHILDNDKLNAVGGPERALCATWYEKQSRHKDGKEIAQLGRNIRNLQKNIYKCAANEFMWTTYKRYIDDMSDKNIKKHYVPCNEKATNKWRHKRYLAYCVNFFDHPDSYDYFYMKGRELDSDRWALSEMIQWIWRSAIRDGGEIWIYVPSSRMRKLLEDWIVEVTAEGCSANELVGGGETAATNEVGAARNTATVSLDNNQGVEETPVGATRPREEDVA